MVSSGGNLARLICPCAAWHLGLLLPLYFGTVRPTHQTHRGKGINQIGQSSFRLGGLCDLQQGTVGESRYDLIKPYGGQLWQG